MTILLRHHGAQDEPVTINLQRKDVSEGAGYVTRIDDRVVDVDIESYDQTRGHLRMQGKVVPYVAVRDGDVIHAWIDGRTYTLDLVPRTAQRAGAGEADALGNDLTAPMPGTVLQVKRQPGEAFEAHEPIIVMESMKMEMTLSFPKAGRLKDVLCEEGQLVELGALLATIEQDQRDASA